MKLYIAAGQYVGTQAEAKALDKEFESVEVPTDKPGLIAYLNMIGQALSEARGEYTPVDDFETIVERQDPEVPGEDTDVSHAESTVDLDQRFAAAPLGQQLTLAAIAVENARSRIGRENAPAPAAQGYGAKAERAAPAADDLDDLLG